MNTSMHVVVLLNSHSEKEGGGEVRGIFKSRAAAEKEIKFQRERGNNQLWDIEEWIVKE